MLLEFNGKKPFIEEDVFLAQGSQIIGEVKIGKGSSIWFNASLRADMGPIVIGQYTNVQDNSVVHIDTNFPTIIGNNVTIGHNAIIHGCEISDNCLIGMGAIILNGAKIGEGSLIGAGSLITENKVIPPRSLVVGVPGKVLRQISDEEFEKIKNSAIEYYKLASRYNSK
jgi:carbonic anhydrase/acetyltransferase-like protein (isoleucine patch superfamily)